MMHTKNDVTTLRMKRQFLTRPANETEYIQLYRDTQPGQNVYWTGFGDPPSITFRASFNDMEFNRMRQAKRQLVKGRFQGGNLGWIDSEDMELFACLCRKPLDKPTTAQADVLELLMHEGPLNIQQMKESTGMLVKEITPILHRLQEAFLIYEDQYDGAWDRGWYKFSEMFPTVNLERFTRHNALKKVLPRFAYRLVSFDVAMAKSFYKLPAKEIKAAINELVNDGVLVEDETGWMLKTTYELIQNTTVEMPHSVYVLHRNDFLVKSNEQWLKEKYKQAECDILQYILIDGEFKGAVVGHFKNGPYVIEDIVLDLHDNHIVVRKDEIIEAVYRVNHRDFSPIQRFMGTPDYRYI